LIEAFADGARLEGHEGPNRLATNVPLIVWALGAAKRKSPTGDCANGIPKYSDTCHINPELVFHAESLIKRRGYLRHEDHTSGCHLEACP
jgi:hypothetical protein